MDHTSSRDVGFGVDLESGLLTSDKELSSSMAASLSCVSPESVGEEAVAVSVKEKQKKTGNKKAPKPPRPPRGPSLDAADQKLIKELAELAMLKRARIERLKALKKMKAAKSSSSGGSSILAMVFTVLFCLVILFHGMSCGRNSPGESYHGSSGGSEGGGGLISVQLYPIPSVVTPNGPRSESPSMVELASGSERQETVTNT